LDRGFLGVVGDAQVGARLLLLGVGDGTPDSGAASGAPASQSLPAADEKKNILDLFKN
jgi:hypothetical protein